MKFRRLVVLTSVVVALTSLTATAQEKELELTPIFGVRTGGEFRDVDRNLRLDLQSVASIGVIFDYPLSENFQLEAVWTHQSSELGQRPTFVPGEGIDINLPGQPIEGDPIIVNMGVDYFHGGILYQGGFESFRPYFMAGAGLTVFNPDATDVGSATRFSFSFGAGSKSFFNERFGFRFDARIFSTIVSESKDDIFCNLFGCVAFNRASIFLQATSPAA